MLRDGFHDIPAGKVAAVVTSLEMLEPPPARPEIDAGWTLARLPQPGLDDYRALYRAVGANWLWFSRLKMPDAELATILGDPAVELYRLEAPGGEVGMLELDFAEPDECELAFFGVTSGLVGGGAARWLMNRAIQLAWAKPIKRFWVHTCTLDHPSAPQFYMRSGFRPYRREIEVMDDPRLAGLAPLDAAPHIPLIRPA